MSLPTSILTLLVPDGFPTTLQSALWLWFRWSLEESLCPFFLFYIRLMMPFTRSWHTRLSSWKEIERKTKHSIALQQLLKFAYLLRWWALLLITHTILRHWPAFFVSCETIYHKKNNYLSIKAYDQFALTICLYINSGYNKIHCI